MPEQPFELPEGDEPSKETNDDLQKMARDFEKELSKIKEKGDKQAWQNAIEGMIEIQKTNNISILKDKATPEEIDNLNKFFSQMGKVWVDNLKFKPGNVDPSGDALIDIKNTDIFDVDEDGNHVLKPNLFDPDPPNDFNRELAEEGFKKLMKETKNNILRNFGEFNKELLETLERTNVPPPATVPTAKAIEETERRATNATNSLLKGKEPLEKKFEQAQMEAQKEDLDSGKDDPKNTRSRSVTLRDILKLLFLIVSVSGLAFGAYMLILYAMGLSGCQLVSCDDKDIFPVKSKALCFGDNHNIFNPKQGVIDFTSDRCNCDNVSNPVNCGLNTCKISSDGEQDARVNPQNPDCTPGMSCQNVDSYKCPMRYYSYSIMDPFSALANAAAAADNAGSKTMGNIWDQIKKAAIVIGIVLAVLGLIFYVIPDALKWDTPSKFGNGGYLGNLSKYNNYAYMGRCGYSNNIPYRYLAARNLINTVS
jgi:hypothetical protein